MFFLSTVWAMISIAAVFKASNFKKYAAAKTPAANLPGTSIDDVWYKFPNATAKALKIKSKLNNCRYINLKDTSFYDLKS
jgi:hypothetical protein